MSDHALMVLIGVVGFVIQIAGLVLMFRDLKEAQRLTRAVAGLVHQEHEQTRQTIRETR